MRARAADFLGETGKWEWFLPIVERSSAEGDARVKWLLQRAAESIVFANYRNGAFWDSLDVGSMGKTAKLWLLGGISLCNGSLPQEADEILMRLVKDRSPKVRDATVLSLMGHKMTRLPLDRALPLLESAAADPHAENRKLLSGHLAWGMKTFLASADDAGLDRVLGLCERLSKDPDPAVREGFIRMDHGSLYSPINDPVLLKRRPEKVAEFLKRLGCDRDPKVREGVAEGYVSLEGGFGGMQMLEAMEDDPSADVKMAVISAYEKLAPKHPEVTLRLKRMAEAGDPRLRAAAVAALAKGARKRPDGILGLMGCNSEERALGGQDGLHAGRLRPARLRSRRGHTTGGPGQHRPRPPCRRGSQQLRGGGEVRGDKGMQKRADDPRAYGRLLKAARYGSMWDGDHIIREIRNEAYTETDFKLRRDIPLTPGKLREVVGILAASRHEYVREDLINVMEVMGEAGELTGTSLEAAINSLFSDPSPEVRQKFVYASWDIYGGDHVRLARDLMWASSDPPAGADFHTDMLSVLGPTRRLAKEHPENLRCRYSTASFGGGGTLLLGTTRSRKSGTSPQRTWPRSPRSRRRLWPC